MIDSSARSTTATSARGYLVRLWNDPESRSILVGIAGVILFYLILGFSAPYLLKADPVTFTPSSRSRPPREFKIELTPDMFAKPPPKPQSPNKFVETNPDAPENTPDKTNNFAAQNQQVAQEKPAAKNESDMPSQQGKKDFESNQIVSGQLAKPVEMTEPPPPPEVTPPNDKPVQPVAQEQNPLTGFDKKMGDSATGFGSNIAKFPENSKPIPNRIEGSKTAPLIQDAVATQPSIDPSRPRPRPSLVKTQQVRPAILAERVAGTTNIGPIAVDARWSNYGAYLQRMLDTVQIQWERLLIESKISPTPGSSVTVKFIMNSKGEIAKIIDHDTTASDQATQACMSAITDRSPYGAWTDDMIAVFGHEQEMTFRFYYQ